MSPKSATWLYRVLENDNEGDPFDFGAVTAANYAKARKLVSEHLAEVLGDCTVHVRFYPVIYPIGVWTTDNYTEETLTIEEN